MVKRVNEDGSVIDVSKAIGLVTAARETLVDVDGDLKDDDYCVTLRILDQTLTELGKLE
jgi:hypothetical protein